jgi:hypothetical protein
VKRYISTVPKGFFDKVFFRPAERGTDEWMQSISQTKNKLNEEFRQVLKTKEKTPIVQPSQPVQQVGLTQNKGIFSNSYKFEPKKTKIKKEIYGQ